MADERGSDGSDAPGPVLWQGPGFGWINGNLFNFGVNN